MEKYNLLKVAGNIKMARVKLNYTQQHLADKLGISQNAYSKIELGQSKISLERLFEICEILNTDPCKMIDVQIANVNAFPKSFSLKTNEHQ